MLFTSRKMTVEIFIYRFIKYYKVKIDRIVINNWRFISNSFPDFVIS